MLVCKGLVSFDADGYGGVLDVEVLDGLSSRSSRSSLSSLSSLINMRHRNTRSRQIALLYLRRIVRIVDGDVLHRRAGGEKARCQ